MALFQFELRIFVSWLNLDARLEISEGIFGSQNSCVCNCATVVGLGRVNRICVSVMLLSPTMDFGSQGGTHLDKAWIQLDGFRGVCDGIAVGFCLEVGL